MSKNQDKDQFPPQTFPPIAVCKPPMNNVLLLASYVLLPTVFPLILTTLLGGALCTPRIVMFANGRSKPVYPPLTATFNEPMAALMLTNFVALGFKLSPSSRYNVPVAVPSTPGATMIDHDVFLASLVVMAICCVARIAPPRMYTGI